MACFRRGLSETTMTPDIEGNQTTFSERVYEALSSVDALEDLKIEQPEKSKDILSQESFYKSNKVEIWFFGSIAGMIILDVVLAWWRGGINI